MKKLISIIFLSLSLSNIHAQNLNDVTASIDQRKKEVDLEIRESFASDDSAKASSLTLDEYITNSRDRNWEGSGNYKIHYKYFYTYDAPNGIKTLVKLVRMLDVGSISISDSYYYNEKGNLIFYHRVADHPDLPEKYSLYLNKEKGIRIIDTNDTRDDYTDGDKEIIAEILRREKIFKLKFTSGSEIE